MARIRTIKPEFAQSESLSRCSRDARLAFVLMWTLADDYGRLRGNPYLLAGTMFPYDKDARELIEDWLEELETQGCIRRYVVDQDHYIEICNWSKHQRIDHPSLPLFPTPPGSDLASPRESLAKPSRALAKVSAGKGRGVDQGSGTMDQGSGTMEVERPPQRAPRGSRLPADWVLSDDLRAWATEERPDIDAERTADEFRDYWTAKPGKDGLKLDWTATWRNWVRNERGHYARNGHAGPNATGETPYQRSMRERMEQIVPSIAAKAPGKRGVIDVEAKNVIVPGRLD